jgi:very-short-patch-repair endonuclease
MGNSVRWTPEQLAEYKARGTVREHRINPKPRGEPPAPPKESKLERRFVQQLAEAGISDYTRNHFPILGRDWELDFCWAPRLLYVEVDGMAHRTKGRFKADFTKRAELLLAGWRGLHVCGDDIRQGRAIEWTKRLLA